MRSKLFVLSVIIVAPAQLRADPPAGYYSSVDESNATNLRATLHAAIDDHRRFPYTSTGVDTWNILELADQDPSDSTRITDVYRNRSYPKYGAGNSSYSREHAWPRSYGFPTDNSQNYPFTDCHHLFLADYSYNSSRGNKPYRTCTGCNEMPVDLYNGEGGPGQSNWTIGQNATGSWEAWPGRRGDLARAVLYVDIRYEGGTHGVTGATELDLRVTDDPTLIATGGLYMGILSDLLRWNIDDPVSAREQNRNDVIFSYQGNRNPFIDRPDWAGCLFRGACPSSPLPLAVSGLSGTTDDVTVDLDWADNTQSIMLGYRVYRSTSAAGPFVRLNTHLLLASSYHDAAVTTGTRYYYRVVVVDAAGRESPVSTVEVWPGRPSGSDLVFINELHYDNEGTDVGEAIEIAGPAGTDLGGWRIIGYNGSGGASYFTINLSGVIPEQQSCYGTRSFAFAGMQNGSPDGIALVDASNNVVEFISYEGVMTAIDGPAAGRVSVDIGVVESGTTPVGHSIQRAGSGVRAGDFGFVAPSAATFGNVNSSQIFTGCGAP